MNSNDIISLHGLIVELEMQGSTYLAAVLRKALNEAFWGSR